MPDYHLNIIVNGQDRASGALRGVAGALGGIAQFALGGLLASGIQRIGAAVGGLAREALAGASGAENLSIALETLAAREMVASGEAESLQDGLAKAGPVAAALQGELRALSLTSPFEAQQVEDAFRLQMAFGATGESAIETAGAILDTGAALGMTNEMMGRMSYNLAQALQQGDLTAANLRQLKMVGLDLSDVFKSELGMSIEDVRDALKSGALTMEDVSGAFVKYAEENFGGASARMSKTFTGLKSSFKDLLYYGGADLLGPALERVTGFLGGLFDQARGLIESGAVAEIGEQLGGVIDRVVEFIGRVGEGGIGALFPPEVVANVEAFMLGLAPIGEILQGEIIPAVVEFLPTLQLWGEQLLILASNALPLLAEALLFVAENWEIFAVIAGIVVAVIVAINAPIAAVIAVLALLYLAWVNDWGGIATWITGVVEQIRLTIETWLTALQMLWEEHGEQIMTIVELAWALIQDAIDLATGVISGIITAWRAAMEGDWQAFGESLRAIWDGIWEGIASILQDAVGLLVEVVGGLIQSIIDKFQSTDWGAVGRGIIDGIRAGLVAAASALANAAANAARAALDAAKGALGIGSPSRVAAEMIGRPFTEGIAAGIAAGVRDLQAAVAGATAGVVAAAGGGGAGLAMAGAGAGGGRLVVLAPVMIREEEYRDVGGEWNWRAIAELISGVEERVAAGL